METSQVQIMFFCISYKINFLKITEVQDKRHVHVRCLRRGEEINILEGPKTLHYLFGRKQPSSSSSSAKSKSNVFLMDLKKVVMGPPGISSKDPMVIPST